jgi:hypothetical protein
MHARDRIAGRNIGTQGLHHPPCDLTSLLIDRSRRRMDRTKVMVDDAVGASWVRRERVCGAGEADVLFGARRPCPGSSRAYRQLWRDR